MVNIPPPVKVAKPKVEHNLVAPQLPGLAVLDEKADKLNKMMQEKIKHMAADHEKALAEKQNMNNLLKNLNEKILVAKST